MSILYEVINTIEVSEALLAWPSVHAYFELYNTYSYEWQVFPIEERCHVLKT